MQNGCYYTRLQVAANNTDTVQSPCLPPASTREPAQKSCCAYRPSILFFNARAPVTQLVRASDHHAEGPSSNPGWTSYPFSVFSPIHSCSNDAQQSNLPKFRQSVDSSHSKTQQPGTKFASASAKFKFATQVCISKIQICHTCKIIIDSRVPGGVCADIHNHE